MNRQLTLPNDPGVRALMAESAVSLGRSAAAEPSRWSSETGGPTSESWTRLTVDDFIRKAEHQFGTSGLEITRLLGGYRLTDRLASDDVRRLCESMGLPAADFGLDP